LTDFLSFNKDLLQAREAHAPMAEDPRTPVLDPTPSSLFGGLSVLKVGLRILMETPGDGPAFFGSAWRGLAGTELKRLCCPTEGKTSCARCRAQERCPYFQLFEGCSSLPGLSEVPRGYILYPPPGNESRERELYLTLLGRCTRYLPAMVAALLKGQKTGLGADRSRYRVLSIEEILPGGLSEPIPLVARSLAQPRAGHPLRQWLSTAGGHGAGRQGVRILTPVRLRRQGAYLTAMDWPFFFESLARRLEAISRVHADGNPLGKETWMALLEHLGRANGFEARMRWHDYHRYSNRQKTKVPMGGLVGEVDLGPATEPWLLEWWRAASLVHVGKGACMGLGRVEVDALPKGRETVSLGYNT